MPLYRCKDPVLFNNYRPISLFCVFQILEKGMYDRLCHYLVKLEIFHAYQFGFQKNKSTYIYLMDKLVKALETGGIGIGIFIDFRKAFDTVDHNILLKKLPFYCIRGTAHNWFSNYLTERHQFGEFNQASSSSL